MKSSLSLAILLPLFSGCGNGSSGTAAVNTITISGTITYTDYHVTSGISIDYSKPLSKPIRGATVVIENSRGQLFSSSTTDAAGLYTLRAPKNSSLNIVVYPILSNASQTINTWIIDNTNERTTHTLTSPLETGSEDDLAIYITSIWGGFFDDDGQGEIESQPVHLESGLNSYAIAGRGTTAIYSTSVTSTPAACS